MPTRILLDRNVNFGLCFCFGSAFDFCWKATSIFLGIILISVAWIGKSIFGHMKALDSSARIFSQFRIFASN